MRGGGGGLGNGMRLTLNTRPPQSKSKTGRTKSPGPAPKAYRIKIQHKGEEHIVPVKAWSAIDPDIRRQEYHNRTSEYKESLEARIRRRFKIADCVRILGFQSKDTVGEKNYRTQQLQINKGSAEFTLSEFIEDPRAYDLITWDPDPDEVKGNNQVARGVVSRFAFTLNLGEDIATPEPPPSWSWEAAAEKVVPVLVVLLAVSLVALKYDEVECVGRTLAVRLGPRASSMVWWLFAMAWTVSTALFLWGYFLRTLRRRARKPATLTVAVVLGGGVTLLCSAGYAEVVLNCWMAFCATLAFGVSNLEALVLRPERVHLVRWCRIAVVLMVLVGLLPEGREFANSLVGGAVALPEWTSAPSCTQTLDAARGKLTAHRATSDRRLHSGDAEAVLERLEGFAEAMATSATSRSRPTATVLRLGSVAKHGRQLATTARAFVHGALGKCNKKRILEVGGGGEDDALEVRNHLRQFGSGDFVALVLVREADRASAWLRPLLQEEVVAPRGGVGFVLLDTSLELSTCCADVESHQSDGRGEGYDATLCACHVHA